MRLIAQPTTDLHAKAAGSPPAPMSLAQWLGSGSWHVHAVGSFDMSDNWIHSNCWRGSRILGSGPHAPQYHITIYGRLKASSFGRVPYRWRAQLVLGDAWITIPSSHPSCKSVADACHQADRALTPEAFKMACEAFYQHRRVQCMVKLVNGRLQPYLSSFGTFPIMQHGYFSSSMLLPSGIYVVAKHGRAGRDGQPGPITYGRYDVSWHGYGGLPAGPEHHFDHWLPEPTQQQDEAQLAQEAWCA